MVSDFRLLHSEFVQEGFGICGHKETAETVWLTLSNVVLSRIGLEEGGVGLGELGLSESHAFLKEYFEKFSDRSRLVYVSEYFEDGWVTGSTSPDGDGGISAVEDLRGLRMIAWLKRQYLRGIEFACGLGEYVDNATKREDLTYVKLRKFYRGII